MRPLSVLGKTPKRESPSTVLAHEQDKRAELDILLQAERDTNATLQQRVEELVGERQDLLSQVSDAKETGAALEQRLVTSENERGSMESSFNRERAMVSNLREQLAEIDLAHEETQRETRTGRSERDDLRCQA